MASNGPFALSSLVECIRAATAVPGSWRDLRPDTPLSIPPCAPHGPINSAQLAQLMDEVKRADEKLVVTHEYDIYCVARRGKDGVMLMTQYGLMRCNWSEGSCYPLI